MRFTEWICLLIMAGIFAMLGVLWFEDHQRERTHSTTRKDCIAFGFPMPSIDSNGDVYCVRRVDGSDEVARLSELIDLENGGATE